MSLKTLIFLFVIGGYYIYTSYKKVKKEAQKRMQNQIPPEEEYETSEEDLVEHYEDVANKEDVPTVRSVSENDNTRKNWQDLLLNDGKSSDIRQGMGSYVSQVKNPSNPIQQQDEVLQVIENENDISVELTFDDDEIRRGIIYSEILKRPEY